MSDLIEFMDTMSRERERGRQAIAAYFKTLGEPHAVVTHKEFELGVWRVQGGCISHVRHAGTEVWDVHTRNDYTPEQIRALVRVLDEHEEPGA